MVETPAAGAMTEPLFLDDALRLRKYVAGLDVPVLESAMHVSSKLAADVKDMYAASKTAGTAAIESFRGDIYSGLRARDLTSKERTFAQRHLRILSGLYGMLRPYDVIAPYRLEAAYRLPDAPYDNLYSYWGSRLAESIEGDEVLDLTSKEYAKLVIPHLEGKRVVSPVFLTDMGRQEPTFVAVHAKIARGAFARWFIMRGSDSLAGLEGFNDLGYHHDKVRSQPDAPVFVCKQFEGLGLSQRKTAL